MGWGSKPAGKQEMRAFGRGKTASAKAAEQYAAQKKRKAEFTAKKRAAQKKAR